LFPQGQGPQPPLHRNCRCRRRFHHQNLVDVPIVITDWGNDEPEDENR
jgi:hypothetical protein